ncbi:DUF6434 domain-containing protein, partial [Streptomyces yangpuensis]
MSTNAREVRPLLSTALTGAELLRWYWTLAELTVLARQMGVPVRGGKAAVTARLAAALDGLPVPGPPAAAAPPPAAGRGGAAPRDRTTVIPPGP